MGAIKREMNSAKWFFIAIGYQTALAYAVGMMVYNFGNLFTGAFVPSAKSIVCLIISVLLLAGMLYLLFRPSKEHTKAAKAKKQAA